MAPRGPSPRSPRASLVGELALLSEAPRSATVTAVRDAELLRLPRSTFERLVVARPEAMLGLARAIVARLQRTMGVRSQPLAERTLALVAGGPEVPLAAVGQALGTALSKIVRVAVLDGSAEVRPAVASADADPEVLSGCVTPSRRRGRLSAFVRPTTSWSWHARTGTFPDSPSGWGLLPTPMVDTSQCVRAAP